MLNVFILDSTAEARAKLIEQITNYLGSEFKDQFLIPRLNLKPISKQELKFNASPDVLVVGDMLVTTELSELGRIRKLLPESAILVKTNSRLENLSSIEQIARMGADDTFSDTTGAFEFLRKIILLARKAAKKKTGKLVLVDSGKGGLGVTSVTAALGECMAVAGKKVALLDFDFDTQDLSRFLQVRPYLNENLQLLFDQQRPLTEESLRQCLVPIWDVGTEFVCMPPVSEHDDIYDPRSMYSRVLLSVLEMLDHLFDVVVVDVGSARGTMLRTLYRVADIVLFVVNNDPAALYSSFDRLSRIKSHMSASADLVLLENAKEKKALHSSVLRQELSRLGKYPEDCWIAGALPHCIQSGRWPGAGTTLYSAGNRTVSAVFDEIAVRLGLSEVAPSERRTISSTILAGFTQRLKLASRPERPGTVSERVERLLESSGTEPLELPAPSHLISPPQVESAEPGPTQGSGQGGARAYDTRSESRESGRGERTVVQALDPLVTPAQIGE